MTAPAADARDETPRPAERPGRRVVSSADLFGNARELVIVHGAEEYRLRITRADKLILTK
jgi:hemin uptake protein HemP